MYVPERVIRPRLEVTARAKIPTHFGEFETIVFRWQDKAGRSLGLSQDQTKMQSYYHAAVDSNEEFGQMLRAFKAETQGSGITVKPSDPPDATAPPSSPGHSRATDGSAPTDDVLVRRLTYALLRRLERERRVERAGLRQDRLRRAERERRAAGDVDDSGPDGEI